MAKRILTLFSGATITAVAKDKIFDFYFENNDLELVAYELLCHLSCYKSFPLSLINFQEVLNHPFPTAPLSLFNPDGSVCKARKNELAPILMSKSNEENTDVSKENTPNVVDLIALI